MGGQASAQKIQDKQINLQQQDYSIKIPSQMQNDELQQFSEDQILNQFYLKNQPFQKQKQYIFRALLLFLIRQIILLIIFNIYATLYFNLKISPYLNFELLGFTYLVLIILSRFQFFQNTPKSYIIFIMTLLLEPFLLQYSYFHFSFININVNFYFLLMRFCCGFFSIITLIIYLCLSRDAIQFKQALIFQIVASFAFSIFVYVYIDIPFNLNTIFTLILSAFLLTLSGLLITLVTKQMFEGRFSVKINQMFGITNAYSFGLFFPCNF